MQIMDDILEFSFTLKESLEDEEKIEVAKDILKIFMDGFGITYFGIGVDVNNLENKLFDEKHVYENVGPTYGARNDLTKKYNGLIN